MHWNESFGACRGYPDWVLNDAHAPRALP
jgi:hypothetical protein